MDLDPINWKKEQSAGNAAQDPPLMIDIYIPVLPQGK